MVSMSEKILELKDSVSDNFFESIETTLLVPVYSNITQLSTKLQSFHDSLESKITHSTHDLASRTLTSIRNLSSTLHSELNSTLQIFHEFKNITEMNYILLQNEFQQELFDGKKHLEEKFELETNRTIKEIQQLQNNTFPSIISNLKNWTNLMINKTEERYVFYFFLYFVL